MQSIFLPNYNMEEVRFWIKICLKSLEEITISIQLCAILPFIMKICLDLQRKEVLRDRSESVDKGNLSIKIGLDLVFRVHFQSNLLADGSF